MTRNLVHMLDHLELPAPVTVGMILVVAALAKGGHLFWAIAAWSRSIRCSSWRDLARRASRNIVSKWKPRLRQTGLTSRSYRPRW
jgi:hypothetical protein